MDYRGRISTFTCAERLDMDGSCVLWAEVRQIELFVTTE